MIVLFRSCETNLSPGSLGDGTSAKPRWNGKYKLEILRKCYLSIQTGLVAGDKIIIINDNTTVETLTWMKNNTNAIFSVVDITSLNDLRKAHPYPEYHPVVVNACPDLMETLITICKDNKDELIYVCEDDYLHTPTAINNMKDIFKNGYSGFYAPYDYPDRYTIDTSRSSEIYATNKNHVRSIPSATLTIAAIGHTWLRYKYELLRAGVFADDTWTWKAFAQVGAVCPIPGQATHLQDNCITLYIDWIKEYDAITLR